MQFLTTAQKQAAVEWLGANGWRWDIDWMDPRGDYRGWWIHPQHPTKCRRTGDAQPIYTAAETTFLLYTGASVEDLPYLCPYRDQWIWKSIERQPVEE